MKNLISCKVLKKVILLFLLPACFLIAACEQSAATTDLFYYHMSGGIAGFNSELKIDKDGVITGHNRMKEYKIKGNADIFPIFEALDKVDSKYFSPRKPEQPECCDQIYLVIQYKGQYLDTEEMPSDIYLEINKAIENFIAPYN